jgi:hypothetical protein
MGGGMVQTPGTAPGPGRLDGPPASPWGLLLRRGLPQFGVEAVLPVVAFYAGWRAFGLGGGIAATSVVSLAISAWLWRRGSDLSVVALGVVFVAIQAVVGLVSHSTTVYLAQPIVFSLLLAIAYVVSVAVGRPLVGTMACAWYPFPASFRASVPYRREFGMQSLVWAAFCIARAALRLVVLLHSGVGGFVVISIATGVPPYVLLVVWGIWHARRSFSRLDASAFAG